MPGAGDVLIGRESDAIVAALVRSYPRALVDNPEGVALIDEAVRRAIGLGLDAGCKRAGCSPAELDFGREDAWVLWQRQRDQTPEARAWPAELAATVPLVSESAQELLEAAGRELGLHGRASRDLRHTGGQAAEAGAALVRALAEPSPAPDPPRAAAAEAVGAPQPDGTVRIAVAANQAEAELLQGVLADAGIPSNWRRTGGDLPELLAAGYREIYVPTDAAAEAQALLAPVETQDFEADPPATRRIGLERTGLRLIGKATAVLVVLSILSSVVIGLATDQPGVGVAVFVAILIAGAATVAWSERARGP